jgi:hypothetical protein
LDIIGLLALASAHKTFARLLAGPGPEHCPDIEDLPLERTSAEKEILALNEL